MRERWIQAYTASIDKNPTSDGWVIASIKMLIPSLRKAPSAEKLGRSPSLRHRPTPRAFPGCDNAPVVFADFVPLTVAGQRGFSPSSLDMVSHRDTT